MSWSCPRMASRFAAPMSAWRSWNSIILLLECGQPAPDKLDGKAQDQWDANAAAWEKLHPDPKTPTDAIAVAVRACYIDTFRHPARDAIDLTVAVTGDSHAPTVTATLAGGKPWSGAAAFAACVPTKGGPPGKATVDVVFDVHPYRAP